MVPAIVEAGKFYRSTIFMLKADIGLKTEKPPVQSMKMRKQAADSAGDFFHNALLHAWEGARNRYADGGNAYAFGRSRNPSTIVSVPYPFRGNPSTIGRDA